MHPSVKTEVQALPIVQVVDGLFTSRYQAVYRDEIQRRADEAGLHVIEYLGRNLAPRDKQPAAPLSGPAELSVSMSQLRSWFNANRFKVGIILDFIKNDPRYSDWVHDAFDDPPSIFAFCDDHCAGHRGDDWTIEKMFGRQPGAYKMIWERYINSRLGGDRVKFRN